MPFALVNAYVTEAKLFAGNEPGRSTLEVVAADALGTIMGQRQGPFTWPNCPDSAVAAAIFGSYGITPAVVPTPPLRTMFDTTTTQRGTDVALSEQLAARNGYEPLRPTGTVSGRDMGHFHPPLRCRTARRAVDRLRQPDQPR